VVVEETDNDFVSLPKLTEGDEQETEAVEKVNDLLAAAFRSRSVFLDELIRDPGFRERLAAIRA
jgi:hypothetical protein